MPAALLAAAWVSRATPVWAHGGSDHASPRDLWPHWNVPSLLGLALLGLLYGSSVRRIWSRAGRGRGVSSIQAAAFGIGLLALAAALASPLEPLAEQLFSAHMAQHLLLISVAAPLLVWGAPPVTLSWGLPDRARRPVLLWMHRRPALTALWLALTVPWVAWGLHGAAVWVWHAPVFYQAALEREFIHAAEHASFFVTALLFWWVVLRGRNLKQGPGLAVLLSFTTLVHTGLLGALLTFAAAPWYPFYARTTPAWGLTALEDQQVAGVVMWVPAALAYLSVSLAQLLAVLRAGDAPDTGTTLSIPNTAPVHTALVVPPLEPERARGTGRPAEPPAPLLGAHDAGS